MKCDQPRLDLTATSQNRQLVVWALDKNRERSRSDSNQVLESGLHGPTRPVPDCIAFATLQSPLQLMRMYSVGSLLDRDAHSANRGRTGVKSALVTIRKKSYNPAHELGREAPGLFSAPRAPK